MKEFAPRGRKFFHFQEDPSWEGIGCAEKQTASNKVVSHVKSGQNFTKRIQFPKETF